MKEIFFIFFCFISLSLQAFDSVEETPLYRHLLITKQVLLTRLSPSKYSRVSAMPLQRVKTLASVVDKILGYQRQLIDGFKQQKTLYNPELPYTFYKTCTLLDDVQPVDFFTPRHLRAIRLNADKGLAYFSEYFQTCSLFFKEEDKKLLVTAIAFYQLLARLYSNEYEWSGLLSWILDYGVHRPWEFAQENPMLVMLVVAAVGAGALWYYWPKDEEHVSSTRGRSNGFVKVQEIVVPRQQYFTCGPHALWFGIGLNNSRTFDEAHQHINSEAGEKFFETLCKIAEREDIELNWATFDGLARLEQNDSVKKAAETWLGKSEIHMPRIFIPKAIDSNKYNTMQIDVNDARFFETDQNNNNNFSRGIYTVVSYVPSRKHWAAVAINEQGEIGMADSLPGGSDQDSFVQAKTVAHLKFVHETKAVT